MSNLNEKQKEILRKFGKKLADINPLKDYNKILAEHIKTRDIQKPIDVLDYYKQDQPNEIARFEHGVRYVLSLIGSDYDLIPGLRIHTGKCQYGFFSFSTDMVPKFKDKTELDEILTK